VYYEEMPLFYRIRRCQTDRHNLRSIDLYDQSVIEGLDRLCFPEDEPYSVDGRWWWLVEDSEENPVGFAGLAPVRAEPGVWFLCRAGVLADHRRQGLAQRLVKARIAFAKSVGASAIITYVDRDNIASGNNLIKAGFKLCVPAYRYGGDFAIYFCLDFPRISKRV